MIFLCGSLVFAGIATAINVVWLLAMRRTERAEQVVPVPQDVMAAELLSIRGKVAGAESGVR